MSIASGWFVRLKVKSCAVDADEVVVAVELDELDWALVVDVVVEVLVDLDVIDDAVVLLEWVVTPFVR
jgi:hypothetical protein